MKLVIAGSRTIQLTTEELHSIMDQNELCDEVSEIISGGAKGIDSTAQRYAEEEHIPFTLYKAEWDLHGKPAGHIRNKVMADAGDKLLLIWDGSSKGSANMKKNMEKLNKPIIEVILI